MIRRLRYELVSRAGPALFALRRWGKAPARQKVTATAFEAGELLLDRAQVMEPAEGAGDEGETPVEVEGRHVARVQTDPRPDLRRLGGGLDARRPSWADTLDRDELFPGKLRQAEEAVVAGQ